MEQHVTRRSDMSGRDLDRTPTEGTTGPETVAALVAFLMEHDSIRVEEETVAVAGGRLSAEMTANDLRARS
jgi:hypothetical protein